MVGKAVPGQLVESRSGRDSGRVYLVVEVPGEGYVKVADGMVRRLENPKKKNLRHLVLHPRVAGEIAEKLQAGERINNSEIRRAIERLAGTPEE